MLTAQCPEISKLRPGEWNGIGPYGNETLAINYANIISSETQDKRYLKIQEYLDKIRIDAVTYIVKRAGIDFYYQCEIVEFKVIYHDFKEIDNFNKVQFDLKKCGKITYLIKYVYKPDDMIEYYFAIEFDEEGKRISNHPFPNKNLNRNFDKIISVCETLEIAEKQNIINIDPIYIIQLEYDTKANAFCWKITQDYRPQLRKKTGINTYEAVSGGYHINLLYINANNGSIIKTDKEYGMIVR